jgi:UDP-glucose 4-epimerase
MKNALVTGGKGFIGSHLVNILNERGYNAVSYDIVDGMDIRNTLLLQFFCKAYDIDVIFNLGGVLGTHELIDHSRVALDVITGGTISCLDTANSLGIDFVEISKPNIWLNTYSITKKAAEDFTLMYEDVFGLPVWIVKWFNIFGPGQHYGEGHPQKLAPTSIMSALKNEPIEIFGDGEQTADHLYVADACHAVIDTYESDDAMGEIIEIGSGEEMTINWFTDQVIEKTGSTAGKKHVPMRRGEDEGAKVRADLTKLQKLTDYKPRHNFDDALNSTIEYYRNELNK